jgi:antitoxin CptB
MDLETIDKEVVQLRWQCRRGMLELDLILGAFLEIAYASLTQTARADFRRLLEESDQTLYEWLIGQAIPSEASMKAMVLQIRAVLLHNKP